MIEIIKADLDYQPHAEALINLMSEYALDPMGGGKDLPNEVKENLASALHEKHGAFVILAYVHNEAVGLVTCIEGFSTFSCQPVLKIHDAIVTAEHRGREILTDLLLAAESIAHELGCCKLTLEVFEGNSAAKSAYKKFGFSDYELDTKIGKAEHLEKALQFSNSN